MEKAERVGEGLQVIQPLKTLYFNGCFVRSQLLGGSFNLLLFFAPKTPNCRATGVLKCCCTCHQPVMNGRDNAGAFGVEVTLRLSDMSSLRLSLLSFRKSLHVKSLYFNC